MKKKISRILGVGLSLMLLLSLIGVATPASASTLSIGAESSVEDLKDMVDNILGPAGVDVIDLAANGDVIYAATGDTTDDITYKSTDGGATWSELSTKTDDVGDVDKTVMLVAVAPDDADVVTIVDDLGEVYFSDDGGSSWFDLNVLATVDTIYAIDVSAGETNYVAIGGNSTATGSAELWTRKLSMAGDWAAEAAEGGFTTNQTNVKAVKFSPNFSTDETITIISGNAISSTFQVFRYTTGSQDWNGSITGREMADYGTGIVLDTIVGGIGAADIALLETYLGTEETERIALVTVAGATSGGGTFRLSDSAEPKQFETWADADADRVGSLAYNDDSGILLGGVYADNKVYTWLSPLSGTSPNAERPNTLKPPSGEDLTVVAWSGDTAVAATSGDESAFAVSTDDGYAWNDISLIDTELDVVSDVAVSTNGTSLYMTSHNGEYASVWVNASSWKRVFSFEADTDWEANFLVRIAPENASAVYVSSVDTADLWVSKNSGTGTWKYNPTGKISYIQDFVVASADVLYAIDDNGATKSTNAGASWSDEEDLDGVEGYMITLAPNGDVLVGGSDAHVAFSKDGGATFTRISDSANDDYVYVVADKDYATNNTIYAASGDSVERGKADKNESWSGRGDLNTNEDDDFYPTGIARYEGVIYVLAYGYEDDSNEYVSRLYRALNLLKADTAELALWSFRDRTDDLLAYSVDDDIATPQALKMSIDAKTKSPKFWAIDMDDMLIDSIVDTIATTGPTLTGPKDAEIIKVNPESGAAYDVTFSWGRYSSKYIVSMDFQIATDKNFDAKIIDVTILNIDTDGVAAVFGPGRSGDYDASFMPGNTYYWRVRHSENVDIDFSSSGTQEDGDRNFLSPWSATQSFTVAGLDLPFVLASPASGSYDIPVNPLLTWSEYPKAIGYEIMLAEDPTFAIIDFSYNVPKNFYKVAETLKYSTTYYWRVRGVTGEAAMVKKVLTVPGGPWVTGVFTTMAEPKEPAPPVIIQQPSAPEVKIVEVPVVQPAAIPAGLLWAIVLIGAVLVIALIVLIVRTRRVA